MEFRSSLTLFGLPLVHVATSRIVDGSLRRGVATGWIALGDVAIGVLFSCGAIAVGGISVGGVSLGVLALGGLAVGVGALGGLAVGVIALGGAAVAWYAAVGGLAVAREYAIGGAPFAAHVVGPLAPGAQPGFPLPQAPFRVSDAAALAGIVVALLVVARRVQDRRGRVE